MSQYQAYKRGIPGNSSSKQSVKPNNPGKIQGFGNLRLSGQNDCTHFISIPFKDENFKKSFNTFRDDLLQNHGRYGVNENIIQKTPKLHRTIVNLILPEQKDIDLTKKVLENEKGALRRLLQKDTQEKHVIIKGLQEPHNMMRVSSFYANMSAPVISRVSNHLTEAFEREKIRISPCNPVANRIVVIQKNLLTDENRDKRIDYTFNPGPILRTYRDYEFGKFDIGDIHMSRRYKYDADGYFEAEMVLRV